MTIIRLGATLLLIFILSTSCSRRLSTDRPVVVSTTGMIHDMVQTIGGDKITALGLMGPGIDPHLYRATESDVSTLSNASLIFYNGLHLESKLIDIFKTLSQSHRKLTIAVSDVIPTASLISSSDFGGFYDPHLWFDVSLWIQTIEAVTEGLTTILPDHQSYFDQRALAYSDQLTQLHTAIQAQLAAIPPQKRILITAHDAFSYFGEAYDFTVMGLQGISTETEAGTHDVQRLVSYIVSNRIPAIFIESSVPVRHIKAVQAACQAAGWPVSIGGELYTDALGTQGTPEETYMGMIRHNVDTIVNSLMK